MIKCFIFDIGNVLLFFDRTKQIQQVSDLMGVEPEHFKEAYLDSGLMDRYEKGLLTTEELFDEFQKMGTKSFTLDDLRSSISEIFVENKSMVAWMRELRAMGKRVMILSNTNDIHYDYMKKHYSFLDIAEYHTLSFRVHALKPERAIYLHALEHAGYAADECLYIDDIESYADAASKEGIHGVHYGDNDQLLTALKKFDFESLPSFS